MAEDFDFYEDDDCADFWNWQDEQNEEKSQTSANDD